MPKPTQADWNAFNNTSREEKAKVLFLYLCQEKVSMEKVVSMVYNLNDPQYTKKVSRITRCYGFEGNNGGKFGKFGATYEDVLSFVNKYPDGTDYDGGETMKEYLMNLTSKRMQIKDVNSNKSQIKKISQSSVKNITKSNTDNFSLGQAAGVDLSQKKMKNNTFHFRDIWGVHGFKRLSWALISLGVSAIPFFVILFGVLFKENGGLKKGGYFDSVFEGLLNVFNGIGGAIAFFWVIPLILFLINGGGYLIYLFYKKIKKFNTVMNYIVDLIAMTIFIFLAFFSAECIIIAVYTLVRKKNRDYLKK